ncbi:universal stress protein [Streptomyces stramineus]
MRTCDKALAGRADRPSIAPRVLRADPGPALVACAHHGGDLLVMGAGSHGPVRRLLRGSVSRHCLKHAHCPVLVVPPGPVSPGS